MSQVYANEDMMVGTWLLGHRVHRASVVAKIFVEGRYQTTLSECVSLHSLHPSIHSHPPFKLSIHTLHSRHSTPHPPSTPH